MPKVFQHRRRTWREKFATAFQALAWGIGGQESFYVHLAIAAVVIALAAWLQLARHDWLLLVLCIFAVLSAEMFNRALEVLARAITKYENRDIERALNVASAAVLLISIGAAIIGAAIFIPAIWSLWFASS